MKYQLKRNKGSLNKVKTNKGKTNKGKTNKARLNKVKINKGRFRNNLKKTYKNIKKGGVYHQQGYWYQEEADSVLDWYEPPRWIWIDTSYYTCDWCGGVSPWQGDHAQYHYCCDDCDQAHWASQLQQ